MNEHEQSEETSPAPTEHASEANPATQDGSAGAQAATEQRPREFGGPKGPEPTRYGDWERKGRCVDF